MGGNRQVSFVWGRKIKKLPEEAIIQSPGERIQASVSPLQTSEDGSKMLLSSTVQKLYSLPPYLCSHRAHFTGEESEAGEAKQLNLGLSAAHGRTVLKSQGLSSISWSTKGTSMSSWIGLQSADGEKRDIGRSSSHRQVPAPLYTDRATAGLSIRPWVSESS